MDPEQTFIRVQGRFSQMLTPRVRAALEYIYLFIAVSLFCILVVMHANYVQQPGCSSELSGVKTTDAQLIQIKITSAGMWSQNEPDATVADVTVSKTKMNEVRMETLDEEGLTFSGAKFWLNWIGSGASRGRMALKSWKSDTDIFKHQAVSLTYSESLKATVDKAITKTEKEETRNSFPSSAKETLEATIINFGNKWHRRLSFVWRHAVQIIGNFQNLWNITGIHLNLDVPKWLHILHLDRLNSYAVQWVENKSKAFEPTYLYTMEKGYFLLPEAAKSQHNIRTINISISAQHSCFGNRWQQLLINRFFGYDTILMNSFLNSPSQGYLFNYQTREFYNLSYKHERAKGPARFGDYLVTKCGVLMISLFVFSATTMSVSFTLRETQTRMLKFTASTPCSTSTSNISIDKVHMIESLVFVPIMIGILFFLFEFYDDHLLAFMVLVFVWLCELFTLISARTPISVKFFPRFFLLYFLVFHIYFFSYAYGFSYLALSTTAAFIQHLILYFWNHFEVPTLQRFMQNRRAQLQQHPDFHITSSTILASTLHITRLNTRNRGQVNADLASGTAALRHEPDQATPANGAEAPGVPQRVGNGNSEGNPVRIPGQPDLQQAETGPSPGTISSFSSLLQWIRGGASSEGLNSFLSMFRDVRDQGPVYPASPVSENRATGNGQ